MVSLERAPGRRRSLQSASANRTVHLRLRVSLGKLVIEADGGQHGWNIAADEATTGFIESRGFRVIRFWNNDVIERIDGVVAQIEAALAISPSPSPSREREGSL